MTDNIISDFVQSLIDSENIVMEEYCEKMLQDGSRGIKIVRRDGRLIEITLTSEVPYGEIHEHSTWFHK